MSALASLARRWTLVRKDTSETFLGQFEAEEVSEDISSAYAERFALNRQTGITQFLHGETETVSFRGRFYNQSILGGSFPLFGGRTDKKWLQLKRWVRRDPLLLRPPILIFFIGDGHLQKQVIIQSITGVKYDQPDATGGFKGTTFTLNLREHTEFDFEETSNFDTRHHFVIFGDYYELLAQREYRNADIGVHLRQQHPTQINLQVGNIVKLPAPGSNKIVTSRARQTSIVFKTSYEKKPTPQRERRLQMLRLRGAAQVSHVALQGI